MVPWYQRPVGWVRSLYDWTLSWAETRYGTPALFLLAFLEASFFPIPPDVLLIALSLSKQKRAFVYAAVCTAGSVCGGILGWYIGFGLWGSLGEFVECTQFGGGAFFFENVPGFSCEKFGKVQTWYADNAWTALFTAGFTPIPYKIFTIAAGVFQVGLPTLILASLVGRGARFFLVAGLLWKFGEPVKDFIDRRFGLLTVAFTALLVGGVALLKFLL